MDSELLYRMMLGVVLVSSLGISGYFRRRARRSGEVIARTREPGVFIVARLLVTLPLMGALFGYLMRPDWLAWSQLALPPAVRLAGALLGLLCIPLVYWVVSSLGRNISETVLTKRDHELVVKGPYRWVRHPLYATGLLLLFASSLLMASWFTAALTLLAAVLVRILVIPREEAELTARFGARYQEYRARTGRLVPRLP